jgi:hypothetical protein
MLSPIHLMLRKGKGCWCFGSIVIHIPLDKMDNEAGAQPFPDHLSFQTKAPQVASHHFSLQTEGGGGSHRHLARQTDTLTHHGQTPPH